MTPFGWRHAEVLFEHGIEEAQMPVTALQCHMDNLGVGVREQLAGFEQTQFGLARADGHAEVLAKKPAEMPQAAPAQFGELFGSVIEQVAVWHFIDELLEARLRGRASDHGRLMPRHFLRKNHPDQVHQSAAGEKVVGRTRLRHQRGEFLRGRIRGGEKARGRRGLRGRLEIVPLGQRQKTAQQFGTKMEIVQLHFAELTGAQTAFAGGGDGDNFAFLQLSGRGFPEPVGCALA